MRKKNLKVQVAALAVTGVIAATPLSVRAEETRTPAAPSTEAASSTATAVPPTTVAPAPAAPATSATIASGAAPTSGVAGTTTAATTAGTGATDPATTTGTATTTAPTAVSSDVIKNADGSISFKEPAVDSGTTAPNNVKDEVTDDKQGTDIQFSGKFIFIPAENSINATISPEKTKNGETLAELPGGFNSISTFSDIKAEDMIMKD